MPINDDHRSKGGLGSQQLLDFEIGYAYGSFHVAAELL